MSIDKRQTARQRLLEEYAATPRKTGARRWTMPELWLIFDASLTFATIARWVGVTPNMVVNEVNRLRAAGFAVPNRHYGARGPQRHLAARNDAILADLRSGMSHADVAAKHEVTEWVVVDIERRS